MQRYLALLVLCFQLAAASVLGVALPEGQHGLALYNPQGLALVEFNSHEQRRLASVTKLFIAAAALSSWGEDVPFRTHMYTTSPLHQGRAQGLLIVGGGDPCLDEHFTDGDPERIFRDWIQALHAAGLSGIDGPLLIDNSLFSGPAKPDTYPQDAENQQRWYSAPASAFAWNDNCIEVQVRPGSLGSSALVRTRPSSERISIDNRTRTVQHVKQPQIIVSRALSGNDLRVTGDYDRPSAWFPLAIHQDADLLHGDHFANMLMRDGLISNTPAQLGKLQDYPQAQLIYTQENPLLPALRILNQRSQNFYGEQLLRLLGARRFQEGSIQAGRRACLEALQTLGLDTSEITLLDGSGLSYNNQASASTICQLLQHMASGPYTSAWLSTLKEDKHPRAKILIKTGTLNVARCLAGYILSEQGPHAFCILLNHPSGRGSWSSQARKALDALLDRFVDIALGPQ